MKDIIYFFKKQKSIYFVLLAFSASIYDGNGNATIAWFCVACSIIYMHICEIYQKYLEGDRDNWYNKFINHKYPNSRK